MTAPRWRFPPRWSTPTLVGCGLASGLLGLVLGGRLVSQKSGPTEDRTSVDERSPIQKKTGHVEPAAVDRLPNIEADWQRWAGQPASLARDEQMAHVLETLAAGNPSRAISLALQQTNLSLRQSLIGAALRGWARLAPEDAAQWVLQRPQTERGLAAAAVLEGVAPKPDVALQVAATFLREDPVLAHDHGCALIFALARVGEFETATTFAATGVAANREAWLDTAFTLWAEHQPAKAAAAAAAIPDAAERETAFRAVITGWAANDPRGLADFALRAPSDSLRDDAMRPALTEWANQDPIAVSAWINRLEPSAILDSGAAAVAIQPPLIARHPDVAVSWAESIFDPELRVHTLAIVVGEWAASDRLAARHYAETSAAISAGDRASLLASPNLQPNH